MGLEAKLVQKMGQSLLMTPQLQQAIKLLQLGRLEYKEAIERELLENPVLEEMRDESEYSTLPAPEPEPNGPAVLPASADNSDSTESQSASTEPKATTAHSPSAKSAPPEFAKAAPPATVTSPQNPHAPQFYLFFLVPFLSLQPLLPPRALFRAEI